MNIETDGRYIKLTLTTEDAQHHAHALRMYAATFGHLKERQRLDHQADVISSAGHIIEDLNQWSD